MVPPSAWETLAGFFAWLLPLLLDHLWQATVFAGLAAASVFLLRRAPAEARFRVWLLAMAKFLLPASLLVAVLPTNGLVLPFLLNDFLWLLGASPRAAQSPLASVEVWGVLGLVWIGGTLFFAARWGLRYRRTRRRIRGESLARKGREFDLLQLARSTLNVRQPVELLLSRRLGEVGVWGVRKPIIVLPRSLARRLESGELKAVLLHEMAHVARRDNLISHFCTLLCCLFWFHPLVWWMDRRLLAEREQACDDRVLSVFKDARLYASSLLKVVRMRLEARTAGMAAAAGSPLGWRMRHILAGGARQPLAGWQRGMMTGLVVALLAFSVLARGQSPCSRSQVAPPATVGEEEDTPRPSDSSDPADDAPYL